MRFRLTANDHAILRMVAECRIATIPQLAVLLFRNPKGLGRRISQLVDQGLLAESPRTPGQRRGRPERVVSLARCGVEVLQEQGLIDTEAPTDAILGDHIPPQGHQLLLNWVRAHLHHIQTVISQLTIEFLSHNSPFLPRGLSSLSILTRAVSSEVGVQRGSRLEPDAVFSISDTHQSKSVLFFLEVDCDTETLASPRRKPTDIRQKILNYGLCFDTGTYKKYEELWNCRLNGFRLLFVTDNTARMSNLCSLVQEMPPSDYIWLTTAKRIVEDGIGGQIWARGGRLDASLHSILGKLCCRTLLP